MRSNAVQHRSAACVPKVHRQVELLASLHAVGRHVEGHKRDEALGQQLGDELPYAAKAGDDDVVAQLVDDRLVGLQCLCRCVGVRICIAMGKEGVVGCWQ